MMIEQPPHNAQATGQPHWGFMVGGLVVIVLALSAIGAITLAALVQNDDKKQPTPTQTEAPPSATAFVIVGMIDVPTATEVPPSLTPIPPSPTVGSATLTFTFAPPSPLPATMTPSATRTPSPTATFTASHTPTTTPTPSDTPTITPTATNTTTPQPPTLTYTPSHTPTTTLTATPVGPTVAYPNGRPVRFFYDDYSFYMWNIHSQQIAVSSISFEGLDSTGEPTTNRMSGELWAQFYGYIESTKCTAIELTAAPGWLHPSQCWDYNAILTPQQSSRIVFWTFGSQGNQQFRVLWNEVEVARCEISAGECSVYLP